MSTATLSGPSTGTLCNPATFTVAVSAPTTGIINLSDSGVGGIFVPEQLQWSNTSESQTFLYIPNSSGSISISISTSSDTITISGSPITLTVSANIATSAIFTGPSLSGNGSIAATVGVATSNFTITPNGLLTGRFYPSDGNKGGTFTPSVLVFSNSSSPQAFTYTPNSTGVFTISLSSTYSTPINPPNNAFSVNALAASATTAALSWVSSTVQAGKQVPTPLSIATNGTYTGVITPSDNSAGGTFYPSSIVIAKPPAPSNASPILFYYTPPISLSGGTAIISITASPSLTITGSPVSITYNPSSPFYNFGPGVYNQEYWPNPLNN